MILGIDAGNTRAKWKLWGKGLEQTHGVFDYQDTEQALKTLAQKYMIKQVYLAEVGSAGIALLLPILFTGACIEVCESRSCLLGVRSSYAEPTRLGVDRFLGFVEAYHLEQGKPVAVLDIGTAATFDVVDAKGLHVGGHIVPGLSLLQMALQQQTDKVSFESSLCLQTCWGQSTQQAVEHGTAAMLLAWARQQLAEFWRCYPEAKVYLAGGLAANVAQVLADKNVILHQDLVLDALKRIAVSEN